MSRRMGGPTAAVTHAVAGAAAGAAAWHGLPALTTRKPVRRMMPQLAGQWRGGGIALTFDDGPDPAGTPAVLAALSELDWNATFFLLGEQTRRYPKVARQIVAAGHEIGVHGDQHRNHLFRSPGWVRRDLHQASEAISNATGVRPRWFRPPYGVLSGASLRTAAALDLTPVLWTAWGRDWEPSTAQRVLNHLLPDLADGGTVLLHDSDCTSTPGAWRATVRALPLLAAELDRRKLDVRPLREHLPHVP